MLEILESPKHLVAFRLSDKLTAEDVAKAYKAAEEAIRSNDRVSFFAEVDPSMQLTFEGLAKDLVEAIGRWNRLKHYHRVALVTDKGWMAALARVEGLVFASIDIRVFNHADRNKAFAWASETPDPIPAAVTAEPSIRFLQTTSANVFAYEVDGRVRERDIKSAVSELKPFFEREGKFNVLARMKDFNGFDLLSIFDDDLIRLKIKAPSKIAKYAVIGPKPWMRNLLELAGSVVSTEIRAFDLSEEAAAWEWIGAQQALLPE
ncbi:MAG TPA: STAS/SEC14 domain-containing protein [Pyrinomonadaceae bacterium]|nr:STAS/SEC14 domain-containing protein [Pyrinomonadaceae bacterium]